MLDNSSFCARISRAQMSASRFGLGKFESIVILTLRRRRDSGAADNRKTVCSLKWRRKRDSNPRASFPANGFQDRRFQPLTHSSSHHNSARSPFAWRRSESSFRPARAQCDKKQYRSRMRLENEPKFAGSVDGGRVCRCCAMAASGGRLAGLKEEKNDAATGLYRDQNAS